MKVYFAIDCDDGKVVHFEELIFAAQHYDIYNRKYGDKSWVYYEFDTNTPILSRITLDVSLNVLDQYTYREGLDAESKGND